MQIATPAGLPEGAAEVLHSPNALVNEATYTTLQSMLASMPNAAETLTSLIDAAHTSLASSLQGAFLLLFVAALLMLVSLLLMPRIDLRNAMQHSKEPMQAPSASEIAAEEVLPVALVSDRGMLEHELHELAPLMKTTGFDHVEQGFAKFRIFGLQVLGYIRGSAVKV